MVPKEVTLLVTVYGAKVNKALSMGALGPNAGSKVTVMLSLQNYFFYCFTF